MKLTVKNLKGEEQGEIEVKLALIESGLGTQAVHDVVVAYQAAQRMGTACTKTMGEVAGTGKKPWRQKGTGMARAGSYASPLWRGGGVVFGPKPRDFKKKVTKKTRRLALRKAISERLRSGDVILVDDLNLESPKTKVFYQILEALDVNEGSALVVVSAPNESVRLAARNIPLVDVTTNENLNTYQLLRYDKLLFTRTAFELLEERAAQ